MQTNLFRLMLPLLTLTVLTACATPGPAMLQNMSCRDLIQQLPARETLTEGQLAAFSIKQEGALAECSVRLEEVTRDRD
jgi:hypothetical protein